MKLRIVMAKCFTALCLLSLTDFYGQIKIGDHFTEISPYSLLELESTDSGLLLPRLTTAQRDKAFDEGTPVGMLIYNTDKKRVQYYTEFMDPNGNLARKGWRDASGNSTTVGKFLPENPAIGDMHYQPETGSLSVFDGKRWNGNTVGGFGDLTLENDLLSLEGSSKTVDLSYLREIAAGEGIPSQSDIESPASGDVYVDKATGKFYVFDGEEWATDVELKARNGIQKRANGVLELGGSIIKPTTFSITASNSLAIKGLEWANDNSQHELMVVEKQSGKLKRQTFGTIAMVKEVAEITATNGQKQFQTPLEISSANKINVFRNGVRVDFTVVNNTTIEVEDQAVCYQNDQIRIEQYN